MLVWASGVKRRRNWTSLSLSWAPKRASNSSFPRTVKLGCLPLFIAFFSRFSNSLILFLTNLSISFSDLPLTPEGKREKWSFGAASLPKIKTVSSPWKGAGSSIVATRVSLRVTVVVPPLPSLRVSVQVMVRVPWYSLSLISHFLVLTRRKGLPWILPLWTPRTLVMAPRSSVMP